MEKFFDEKGGLTTRAKQIMLDLTYGLEQLISSDSVTEMTENELRMLSSHLLGMIADAVSKKISCKLQQKNAFDHMSDEEFENYLKEKYGTIWRFVSLTEAEYQRVPSLTEEQINRAIQEGYKARKIAEESYVPPYIDPGLRFK